MTPQQKRAIIVMIESIEHQLAAVKALMAEAGDGAALGGGHTTRPISDGESSYLSDAEEEKLGKLFGLSPDEKQQLLDEFHQRLEAAGKEPEGTSNGPFSDQV